MMMRGIRGATTIVANEQDKIITETEKLICEMVQLNNVKPEHVASVFISATEDINTSFPAAALRNLTGWSHVPVMCMREIPVSNSLPLCIRVMMHVNTEIEQQHVYHVFLNNAVKLRPDLTRK